MVKSVGRDLSITMKHTHLSAFTLIELLVVISIIGILLALSVFGLQGARQSSRDATRKSNLQQIRSGLEIFKADCDSYYIGTTLPSSLIGIPAYSSSCLATNTYILAVPSDPVPETSSYAYSSDGTTYTLCATLEQPPSPAMDITGCGSCETTCNYKVTNP
jgi:prepilin-type N-terminal cleavage/methylation domain-containing protein